MKTCLRLMEVSSAFSISMSAGGHSRGCRLRCGSCGMSGLSKPKIVIVLLAYTQKHTQAGIHAYIRAGIHSEKCHCAISLS